MRHDFTDSETVMTGSLDYLHEGAEWQPFWAPHAHQGLATRSI